MSLRPTLVGRLLPLCLILLLAQGCSSTQKVSTVDKLDNSKGNSKVLLMPIDVELSILTATGLTEPQADQSKESTSLFWNTHPPSEEQAKTLHDKAIEYQQTFEQAELLLNKHAQMGYAPGDVHFFFGELYRMRNADGDKKRAELAYLEATTHPGYPPEAHKQLGYHFLKSTEKDKARTHFELYLQRDPQATDHAMINYYLNTLR